MSIGVVSLHELHSIRTRALTGRLVLGGDTLAAEPDSAKKAARKAASLEKSGKWKDTLVAQRQAKEDARRTREEDLEAARLIIDKEVRPGDRGSGTVHALAGFAESPRRVCRWPPAHSPCVLAQSRCMISGAGQ